MSVNPTACLDAKIGACEIRPSRPGCERVSRGTPRASLAIAPAAEVLP